jgi:hypothetical protein
MRYVSVIGENSVVGGTSTLAVKLHIPARYYAANEWAGWPMKNPSNVFVLTKHQRRKAWIRSTSSFGLKQCNPLNILTKIHFCVNIQLHSKSLAITLHR